MAEDIQDKSALLLDLLRTHSFKAGNVVLSSGRSSSYLIDCKQVLLTALGHQLVGHLLVGLVRELDCRTVAGVAVGGCSLASSVSLMSSILPGRSIDALYVRKEAKQHGAADRIVGRHKGLSVVLLEDVVTTGASSLVAIQALREHGYEVKKVLAVVDRLEGAAEALNAVGVPLQALYTANDFGVT